MQHALIGEMALPIKFCFLCCMHVNRSDELMPVQLIALQLKSFAEKR
jgi:hypothetical protein